MANSEHATLIVNYIDILCHMLFPSGVLLVTAITAVFQKEDTKKCHEESELFAIGKEH
jgi:hypothetical protein